MNLKEKNLFINYFMLISELPPCGENSLWHVIDFGGYSSLPICDIIKENPQIDFYIYYGDEDYLDVNDAIIKAKDLKLKNFQILKNTKHQVFMQNPEAFLKQFFIDMQ